MSDNEQQTNRVETALQEFGNLLRSFLLSSKAEVAPATEFPYYGPDASMYAALLGGMPAFPMANFKGEITVTSLEEAFNSVRSTSMLSDEEKQHAFRKIMSAYHACMLENADLESQIRAEIETPATQEQTIDETPAQAGLSEGTTIYEFAFSGNADMQLAEEGDNDTLLYRNVLRTGRWTVSPNGSKDPLVIDKQLLDNLVASFNDGAFEYVTVPETHEDLPSQNRGFIRSLSIIDDPQREGEYILRGGFQFTNEEARKAALEGSIAGVSCGIAFKHPRKSDGKLFDAALHHVALTNKPWIDGLGSWEKIAASEFGVEVVVGLEEDSNVGGQENTTMSETPTNELQLSQEQIQEIINENNRLKLAQTRNEITEKLRPYQTDKKLTPAVLAQAEKLMLAAALTPKMLTLSENNTQVEIDLSETVTALLDAMPEGTDLSETPVNADQKAPPKDAAEKTPEQEADEWRMLAGISKVD